MKKIIYLLLLLNTIKLNAQVPNLEWFKHIQTHYDANNNLMDVSKQIKGIKADKDGKIIACGEYYSTIQVGGMPFSPSIPGTSYNSFIIKLNQDSSTQWFKKLQGQWTDIRDMKLDKNGNIYLTGTFYSPNVDFDPGVGVVTVQTSQVNNFIMKLDVNGNFQWVKVLRDNDKLYCGEMNLDVWGNIYLSGAYSGDLTFHGLNYFQIGSNIANTLDFFIVKLDSTGEYIWSKTFKGNITVANVNLLSLDDKEIYTSVVPDDLGNVYFSSNFRDSVDVDPGVGVVSILANTPNNPYNAFIAKYDSSGNVIWGKKLGQVGSNYVVTTKLDNANNIIMVGGFRGNSDFNPDPLLGDNLSSPNDPLNMNTFILKLNSSGAFIWVKPFYGYPYSVTSEFYLPSDFCIARDNNIYITGFLFEFMDFDTGPGINLAKVAYKERAGYVTKLDINGNMVWYNLHSTYPKYPKPANYNHIEKYGSAVAIDSNYNVFSGGRFGDTVDVDFGPLTMVKNCYIGDVNIYIQKHKQCIPSPVTTTVTATTLSSNQTGSKYQWVTCDSAYTPIAGATSQTYTPTGGGNYAVVVTNNNCSDLSPCTLWWPVGINNYEENKLSFYPNPVNDIVTITLNNSESNTQITLSDLRGRILQTLNFKQTDKMTINMKNLSQGIYIIHVIAGEWSRKIKVTKE